MPLHYIHHYIYRSRAYGHIDLYLNILVLIRFQILRAGLPWTDTPSSYNLHLCSPDHNCIPTLSWSPKGCRTHSPPFQQRLAVANTLPRCYSHSSSVYVDMPCLRMARNTSTPYYWKVLRRSKERKLV